MRHVTRGVCVAVGCRRSASFANEVRGMSLYLEQMALDNMQVILIAPSPEIVTVLHLTSIFWSGVKSRSSLLDFVRSCQD